MGTVTEREEPGTAVGREAWSREGTKRGGGRLKWPKRDGDQVQGREQEPEREPGCLD